MPIRFHRLRPSGPDHAGVSRRFFLMTTSMAGITTGALLGGARAAAAAPLGTDQSALLLRMVQDIYPHPDLLNEAHYAAIVAAVTGAAEGSPETAAALTDGLTRIDAAAQETFGAAYSGIEDADAREGILRRFQHEGFFQNVRWTAYFGIYDNKDIWPLFGYQGSSVEFGGYIDRGFSDIDFVPQGPTLEQRLAEVR